MAFSTKDPWYANGTLTTNGTTTVVGASTVWTDIGLIKLGDMLTLDGLSFYQIKQIGDGTTQGNGTAGGAAGTQTGNNTIIVVDRTIPSGTGQSYSILKLSSVNPINSDIAYKVSAMVQSWQGREDELIAWLAGASGSFPLTDAIGNTIQVKSPAQMQADVDSTVASIAAGGMTGVMTAGSSGNIPAASEFALNNSTGTVKHFAVDEATGNVTAINLAGMMGNISNPLVDLPLNQLELLPFGSGAFTVTSAAAAVANYPLRSIGITLTAGAIAGNVAGQFATINGVDYHITVVAGAVLTLEYSIDLADPVAGDAIISIWRMAGKYAGNTTFTRSTRKTYIDPLSGLLRAVPAGFPALERMANGKVGYLSEGTSTNLCLHSDDIGTGWTLASATVTTNSAAAPDGTTTADTITATAANGEIYQQVVGGTANASHTASIWIKRKTGTGPLYLIDPIAGRILITESITSTGWTRIQRPAIPTTTTPFVGIRLGVSGDEFYVWGAQLEALPFATSYIPTTTAAVTRAGDLLYIQAAGNKPLRSIDHSVILDCDFHNDSTINQYPYYVLDGSNQDALYLATDNLAHGWYGGVQVGAFSVLDGVTKRLAITVAASQLQLYGDGIADGASAAIGQLSAPAPVGIYIGSSNDYATSIYGHIGALKIYPFALTASEIAAA